MNKPQYIVGLDLGQRKDYTAVTVLARGHRVRPVVTTYDVVQLDRIRDRSYPDIVDQVIALLSRPELHGAAFGIDETGVGAAIGDMLERRGRHPKRITITAGHQVTRHGNRYGVPKKDLVTTLTVLLESQRLKVAEALPLASTFVAEAENFRTTTTLTGHQTFGAGAVEEWREGAHDDLILAVAVGAWVGENCPSSRLGSIPW